MAISIAINPEYTKIVWSVGSEISRSLCLVGRKCVEIQTYCDAKHMIAQLAETRIKAELKWMVARLQMNENFGP